MTEPPSEPPKVPEAPETPIVAEPDDLTRDEALRQWLGVQAPAPTKYDLLGLPTLTADRNAIFEAGRQAKRKLRAYQIGRYKPLALKLLAEVGTAVSTLTNEAKKREYDNRLMVRFRENLERVYNETVRGQPHEPGVLEAFLTVCRDEGLPVVYLLPWVLRHVRSRSGSWPPVAEHGLALPGALWVYHDIVVLGQCLKTAELEARVRRVQRAQKSLGIPPGLALLVADEVGRNLARFESLRLVKQAREDPRRTILRVARRVERLGGHIDRRSKTVETLGRLLGRGRSDVHRYLEEIDELPVEVPPGRRLAMAARRARSGAHQRSLRAGQWVARRPQILVGVAVAIGIVAFALSLLAAVGLWRPWESWITFGFPPHDIRGQPPSGEVAPGPETTALEERQDDGEGDPETPAIEGLEEFIRKYPADGGSG